MNHNLKIMDFNDSYEDISSLNHIYISENIPTNDTKEAFEEIFTEGCDCHDLCKFETCSCLQKYGTNYNVARNEDDSQNISYILDPSKYSYGLYECNLNCMCVNKLCGNRLVQFGPRKNLGTECIAGKGRGLFTKTKIIKGSFICEYAGEIISKFEALKRFQLIEDKNLMNYILCINEYFGSNKTVTFIDPTYYGNIGRYINHSCNPNCELLPVRINNTVPKLCIFAKKDIDKNCEVTFSYGECDSMVDDKNNLKPCLCSEETCKKWLPYLPELCK